MTGLALIEAVTAVALICFWIAGARMVLVIIHGVMIMRERRSEYPDIRRRTVLVCSLLVVYLVALVIATDLLVTGSRTLFDELS